MAGKLAHVWSPRRAHESVKTRRHGGTLELVLLLIAPAALTVLIAAMLHIL